MIIFVHMVHVNSPTLIYICLHKTNTKSIYQTTTDRGNVGVVLFNFGSEDFNVEVGDRIAQLILEQISMVPAVQVEELTETERGVGGFGSTGVSSSSGSVEKKARTISPTAEGVQKKME